MYLLNMFTNRRFSLPVFFIIVGFIPWLSLAQVKLSAPTKTSLKELVNADAYVDKTQFTLLIVKRIRKKNPYIFLSRPRRFGKSVLVDTLASFYRNERFLFNRTYMYDKLDVAEWKEHPVLKIDFSQIESDDHRAFKSSFLNYLQDLVTINKLKPCIDDIGGLTQHLITSLEEKYKLGVVVLIDEYDVPYISHDPDSDDATKILLTLKTFYLTLKSHSQFIHMCFITGVTRITLTAVSSAFSSFYDITFEREFATIVGFTETELKQNFGHYIDAVANIKKNTSDAVQKELELWFDGYQFACDGERVYNPCSVIQYFLTDGRTKTFWTRTGTSSFLRKSLSAFPFQSLELIVALRSAGTSNRTTRTEPILEMSSNDFKNHCDVTHRTFRTLVQILVYHGYLTINECTKRDNDIKYSLRFPNHEVKSEYISQITSIAPLDLVPPPDLNRLQEIAISATKHLRSCEWEQFVEHINLYLAQFPYTMFTDAKEKLFQVLFQIEMIVGGFNPVDVDVMTSRGRADVVMSDHLNVYITECKLDSNKENALDQCATKYAPMYLKDNGKNVVCIWLQYSTTLRKVVLWGVHVYSSNGDFIEAHGKLIGNTSNIHQLLC